MHDFLETWRTLVAKKFDFGVKRGIFEEQKCDFHVKWGIFQEKMQYFGVKRGILQEKMCDFCLNGLFLKR